MARRTGKGWGPKSATLSRDSVHAIDRAIETRTRQDGQAQCREDSDAHKCDTCGDPMYDDRSTCELCRSGYAPDFD